MYHAMTIKPTGGGLRNRVISENIHVYDFGQTAGSKITVNALWDTGATNSVVTQKVISALGLTPINTCKVLDTSGERMSEVFSLTMQMPNMVINIPWVLTGRLDGGMYDMLIGMDVINLGDFSITNKNGNTIFSFRMPSQEHIDYVDQHTKEMNRLKSGGFRNKR